MQSKEMVEAECKAIQRTVEKQSQLLQKAQEVERGLNAQIVGHNPFFPCTCAASDVRPHMRRA